ncbi:MAG: FliM/FliN family flagellar motor switch protein [Flavobacteriaceae bacterium]
MASVDRVTVELSVELGHTYMPVHQLLRMGRGAVIELNRTESDPLPVYANNKPIAVGSVVVENDRIAIDIQRMLGREDEEF